MNRPRVPLRKFVKEYSVRNKANEDIPVYSVTNSQGFCTEYFGKEVASHDKTTYKIVPRGYFAYNPSRINVGSVDWQRCEERVIVSPLYTVFSVSDEIDCQYLYYFLRSDFGKQMIKARASGSVRDNLKLEMLKEMTIPDISKEEQRFCAQILDRLQKLIQLRKQELQKLDDLIKARFIEMFGDPFVNEMNWPKLKIAQAVTVEPQNGMYKPQTDYVTDGTGVPILRIDGFYDGEVTDWTTLKRLNCPDKDIEKYLLLEDDFVINRVNSIEYLGKCAHISNMSEPTVYESNMMRMHFDQARFNPVYITRLLCTQYMYDQIINHAKKAVNQASINQKDVLDFDVYQPPKELQDEFADFIKQVNKSKLLKERQVGFIAKISQKPGR